MKKIIKALKEVKLMRKGKKEKKTLDMLFLYIDEIIKKDKEKGDSII